MMVNIQKFYFYYIHPTTHCWLPMDKGIDWKEKLNWLCEWKKKRRKENGFVLVLCFTFGSSNLTVRSGNLSTR